MTEFAKFLGGIKVKLGIKNDAQLAMRLGITQSRMCQIMTYGEIPSDEVCLKIAELAGEDPKRVILIAHKLKASESTRPHWEQLFNLLPKKAAVAASLALFLALPFGALGGSDFALHNTYRNISYATLINS